MLAKYQDDKRSIAISSIKCLNFKFLYTLKLYSKHKFMDIIVNNIRLTQNLACVRNKRTCNPIVYCQNTNQIKI